MMKIIRFNKQNLKKYKKSLEELEKDAPVLSYSVPYIGMLNDKEVISAVWINDMNEISIYTKEEFREKGIMTQLISEIVDDVFKHKLEEISALPMNRKSLRLLKRCGFFKSEGEETYLEFYIR